MSQAASSIQFEQHGPHVGVITVNRPDVRNALDWAAMEQLASLVDDLDRRADLRAVILTGAGGRAFISGGDLRALYDQATEQDGLRQHDLMAGTLDKLATLPVPAIAALEGATRGGGCEVALACDLRIAAQDATLAFAQIGMAVTPGWGGAERLFRLVGYARAVDLLLTGRTLDADEALSLGLVNRVCPPGRALDEALQLAESIADGPPLAMRGVKDVLRGYLTLPAAQARAAERTTFGRLWASADHAEAASAFLDKRQPVFRGA